MLTDLDYFTYYEFYTESHSSCGGFTATDVGLTKTGKAVKFVDNVNEFWIDRDYHQSVTLTITNTDIIDHNYQLYVVNDNEDIEVSFVGGGSNGREASLSPDAFMDVELVIHAPDAQKTLYDIYLKIVCDEGEFDAFVDYSHAIVHVRPFVANLDIQPVESDPGMMTCSFRLFNYGDTLSDIEVYVDEDNRTKTWMAPEIHHCRLVRVIQEPGDTQFVVFDIHAQEYTSGTVYARSGDHVVSAPFEIGCPDGYELNTYTVNNLSIVAEIKDWYCTNKMKMELPFAIPRGFGHDDLVEAALEVNFSLPMSHEKYDPHTVKIFVNKNRSEVGKGGLVALLEDTIPDGQYIFRIPTSFINLVPTAPSENHLTLEVEGIGEGQYIVVTDFRIILNVDEMKINLCKPPGGYPVPRDLPDPETKIMDVEPKTKFRPGDRVDLVVKLNNDDNKSHHGRLTILLENNSYNGSDIPPITKDIEVPPGGWTFPADFHEIDPNDLTYTIPPDADDIEYTISATFENYTENRTCSFLNRPAFYVRTPLIIIHGVAGSKLRNVGTGHMVWGGVWNFGKASFGPLFEGFFDELECNSDGSSINNIVAIQPILEVLKVKSLDLNIPVISTDVFDGLQNYLIEQNYIFHPIGSEIDFDIQNFDLDDEYPEDTFYFVYDWRLDNFKNASNLESFILELTQKENSKVNIVVHSMGGLVAKSLLSVNPLLNERINKLIFLGTPHLRAVKAFASLKYGENDFFINKNRYKTVGKHIPSGYQLLPSEKYFDHYPDGYYELNGVPINTFPAMKSEMESAFFNMDLFEDAKNLHSTIDGDSLELPSNTYNIVGCKKSTIIYINEGSQGEGFEDGDGDKTVPLKSALAVDARRSYAALYAKHSNLPSQKGVQLLIRSLLNGYETDFQTDLFHPVAEYCDGLCGLSGLRIIMPPPPSLPGIQWAWPKLTGLGLGEFTWHTGNGVHIGILGSDYQITNDGVEISVPEGSVYTLDFHGIDQEYLDIKFQLMSEGGVIKTYIFADLTLDIDGCAEVTFDLTDAMTDPVLRLDNECDGTFEVEDVPPSYILDEEESNDFIAPATTANITGTMGENDWYISNVSINLAATDNTGGSDILATRFRLQGDEAFTDYAGPIQITESGNYTLTYYSIDKNLNKETEKIVEFKIDKVAPQILSVIDEGYFSLGTASFSASWNIETGISGLQDVRYSLGTAPGLTDIVDWASAGAVSEIQLTGLLLVESCAGQIYINVRAVNGGGVRSDIVSSDGVIVLESGGDPDGDGFDNESELAARSNPCNELSFPKTSVSHLKKGFNFVSIPAEVMFQQDLRDWLPTLGDGTEIEKVMIYDNQAGKFITLIPGDASNPSFILQGGDGLIVYAKQDKEITFTSVLCSTLDLKPGFNLVGFACPADGYTAYQLLSDLGSKNVSSIQRYSTEKGAFETAGFTQDGQLVGVDFVIVPGEGYFIYMK